MTSLNLPVSSTSNTEFKKVLHSARINFLWNASSLVYASCPTLSQFLSTRLISIGHNSDLHLKETCLREICQKCSSLLLPRRTSSDYTTSRTKIPNNIGTESKIFESIRVATTPTRKIKASLRKKILKGYKSVLIKKCGVCGHQNLEGFKIISPLKNASSKSKGNVANNKQETESTRGKKKQKVVSAPKLGKKQKYRTYVVDDRNNPFYESTKSLASSFLFNPLV